MKRENPIADEAINELHDELAALCLAHEELLKEARKIIDGIIRASIHSIPMNEHDRELAENFLISHPAKEVKP